MQVGSRLFIEVRAWDDQRTEDVGRVEAARGVVDGVSGTAATEALVEPDILSGEL